MLHTSSITSILVKYQNLFGPVVSHNLNGSDVCALDFTCQNPLLDNQPLEDTRQFEILVNQMLASKRARIGVGGYLENRVIYRRSLLFSEANTNRTIHLGVDIWASAGTPVLAPLAAVIHSFQDNDRFGDYGPTIILQHQLESTSFYTLYGHLSRSSLYNLVVGKKIARGQAFGAIGPYPENGDWPSHLHFQLITDILNKHGDFPGVCSPAEKEAFAQVCLNPNLILQSRHLTAF